LNTEQVNVIKRSLKKMKKKKKKKRK